MTKSDLTYEELVEDYEQNDRDRKAGNVLSSMAVAVIMLYILHLIYQLAVIGVRVVAESYQVNATTCEAFVYTGAVILGCYVVYHVCINIIFTYRDEIEDFGARWKRFKLFEKKEKKMEEEL